MHQLTKHANCVDEDILSLLLGPNSGKHFFFCWLLRLYSKNRNKLRRENEKLLDVVWIIALYSYNFLVIKHICIHKNIVHS